MSGNFFGFTVRAVVSVALALTILGLRPAAPAFAAWLGPEKQLTANPAYSGMPDISGTKVVYDDYRNLHYVGEPGAEDMLYDIRIRDLKTGSDKILTPKHTAWGDAAISGSRVVWDDYGKSKATRGIWYHNLSSGTHKFLTAGGGGQIDGSRMCYGKGHRVYVYSFTTRKSKVVSPKGMDAEACDISGTTVVWQTSNTATGYDVYSYSLTTKKMTRLTTNAADQVLPRIDGKLVVWADGRNGIVNYDIYLYNLTTHVESRVTTADEDQSFPAISGGRIVWQDERFGVDNWEVYMYDVATAVQTRVSTSAGSTWNPAISGNRIVYQDDRSGESHLYLSEIVPPVLTAGALSPVASGASPVLSGRLAASGGVPLSGKFVMLQYSTNGTTWLPGGNTTTNIDGRFVITGPAIVKKTYLRARFLGGTDFAPAVSAKVKVKVT